MIAAAVLLSCSLAAQTAPLPDAARLVEQLGSPKFSEREAATRTLEQLGAPAIPHLLAGRESKDLEVRTRSAAILRRVQGALLTQQTMIPADFEDTALADLVRVLGERTGMSIGLNRYLDAKDKKGIRYCLIEEGARILGRITVAMRARDQIREPLLRELAHRREVFQPVLPAHDEDRKRLVGQQLLGLGGLQEGAQRHADRLPPGR